ncbi:hypothetical protein [Actinophytocola xanthii]|uniref:Uncharacterized protein n=1 Tax=Actinophytocola xanthii TaxID=1912961 RepID=A0A1Q8CSK0_9PSEU|nr:hypothetical protein [Actinophytocola xanthii]OLF17297.1 hypothetical protein BU204_11790 [Actinophytocola xanthii]
MHTERTLVTRALLAFCVLGAVSAAIPLVALLLLVLLVLAGLGGIRWLIWAWHTTRFETPEPVHRVPAPAVRREVA